MPTAVALFECEALDLETIAPPRLRRQERSWPACGLVMALLLAAMGVTPTFAAEPAEISYEKQIEPFFKAYCVGCHNGDEDSKGGLNLLRHEALLEGGDSGQVLVVGKGDESRLVKLMLGDKPKMPPKDAKQPTADEIAVVKRWIDLGAKGPTAPSVQGIDESRVPHVVAKAASSPAVAALAFSADGKWLVAARDHEVSVWNATGNPANPERYVGAEHPINAVAFHPDGRRFAAAEGVPGISGQVRIWELGSPQPRTLTGHTDSIYGLAYSPDGKLLATASYDKLVLLWDAETGAIKHTLKHHTGAVFSLAFSPDGKTLASVAADQTVKLWSVENGQRLATLLEPTKGLNAVAFHPRGDELVAVGVDRMLRVWEWKGNVARLKRSAFAHDAPVLAVAYSPDGKTLFTSSEDRQIKAWDSAELRERHVYEALPDWPLSLAVSRDGTRVAAGLYNGDLTLFDASAPRKIQDYVTGVRREVGQRNVKPPVGKVAVGNAAVGNAAGNAVSSSSARGDDRADTRIRSASWRLLLASALFGQTPAEPKPNPPTPRLDGVSPRSAVRGSKLKLTLSGQNLWQAERVVLQPVNLSATLLPGDEKAPNQAVCEIDLPADFRPGLVQVRVQTPLGSTAAKPFYVGPFAETPEKEENGTPATATSTALPATFSGLIAAKGDIDCWSFDAPAGQELVFQLLGANLGSILGAQLTLLDEGGRTLGTTQRFPSRNEVVLAYRTEQAGKLVLKIQDRNFTGSGNHFYLVQSGVFPYVSSVFPLAIRAASAGMPAEGEVNALEATGFNLGANGRIAAPTNVGGQSAPLDVPAGTTLNAARYEASPFAEYAESEPNNTPQQAMLLPVPSGVSGRISSQAPETGDADTYSFVARQGERLSLEVFARRLGSPLDSVIEILDAQGVPVGWHTVRAVAETYTVLRDHDSRSKGIRLQNWDDLQVNDFVMLGGEIVKVQILPLGPDEDVKFFDKGGARLGFLGTTPQAHALSSAAYKVEMHPPGLAFPPNGMPVVQLKYANDDGAPDMQGDSRLFFDVPADGTYLVRVRDVRGLSGPEFVYRLVIRPRQDDFRISLAAENPNVPRGGNLAVTVNAERLDGFTGPIDVRIEGLPAGVTATTTRIQPGGPSGVLILTAAADAPQPAGDDGLKMQVVGQAQVGEQRVEHNTAPMFGVHQVALTSPPDLMVRVDPPEAVISPDQELRFTVTIERRNGFQARVPIDVLNLPHGLRVLDVGLNGVLVTEQTTSRTFVVHCDPWAEPGVVTFYGDARVEAKNERHASPPVRLQVRPAPALAAGP